MQRILSIIFMLFVLFMVACSQQNNEMSLQDFAKIEAELNLPHPDLNPELAEKVVTKHGYTLEQYREMAEKVEKDVTLREKLGELQLKNLDKGK